MRIEVLCSPRIEPTLLESLVEERAEMSGQADAEAGIAIGG
jgi:hypothetical protein